MNDFYVYLYLDRRRLGRYSFSFATFFHEPFYLGKGHGRRMLKHRWDTADDHRTRRIRSIKDETGAWPEVIVLQDGLTEEEAFRLENELILSIGRRSTSTGPLTNLNDGGSGGTRGCPCSEEKKRKISDAQIGVPKRRGWSHSEEAKQKMRGPKSPSQVVAMTAARQARKGPMPEAVRRKISQTLMGNIPWNKGLTLIGTKP